MGVTEIEISHRDNMQYVKSFKSFRSKSSDVLTEANGNLSVLWSIIKIAANKFFEFSSEVI